MRETAQSPAERLPAAVAQNLELAAGAIARLDSAVARHPLALAWSYRARLEAIRRQAAVDGQIIDPWHLAALIEGVRFRVGHVPAMLERGLLFAAARHAFGLYRWFVRPDQAQQAAIADAAAQLGAVGNSHSPLLGAAFGVHAWLDRGGERPPFRAALAMYWLRRGVTALPCPLLTGAGALRADVPWVRDLWIGHFLDALAEEAEDGIALMAALERQWFAARAAVAGRRCDSRAGAAVDILAAAPVVSATTLGQALGMATKNATRLLEGFVVLGIASEVTHRSKRRLYGLKHLAPLREAAAPPRRPLPGRRPGRPSGAPFPTSDANEGPAPTASVRPASPPLPPLERREYSPTVMRDHEYKRCGTLTLMAGTDLLTGHVHALVKERHRSREFIEFLKLLDTVYPADTAIEVILDNHSAHVSRETTSWLAAQPIGRFTFTFTPTHGSWLNLIEGFFSKLARSVLRHIRVASKHELRERLLAFISDINREPVVHTWHYKIDDAA